MTRNTLVPVSAIAAVLLAMSAASQAHEIASARSNTAKPDFDILRATATVDGRIATFAMEVAGVAGALLPEPTGALPGAKVTAYVWPTGLDPAAVGFAAGSGILALAVTAHPDFDDTPLFDENRDGDPANDGKEWHTHWVVLAKDDACGAGLKVRDVSPGSEAMPATAPGLPLALDSPGMSPLFSGQEVKVRVPLDNSADGAFDAVTATLAVHAGGGTPLLCVTGVEDIASGDLSMPGRIVPAQ